MTKGPHGGPGASVGAEDSRYRALVEHMLSGLAYCRLVYDDSGRASDFVYLDVNAAFTALTGLTNVVGRRVSDVIPGIRESNPELFDIYGRVAATGAAERFEFQLKSTQQWLDVSAYSPAREYFIAIFNDITPRKRAQQALVSTAARRQLMEAALQAVPNAVLVTDTSGRVEWINKGFTTLTGYAPEEAIGANPRDLVRSGVHDEAFYKGLWETILSGRTWKGLMVNRRKDGSTYPDEMMIAPIVDENNAITHFVAVKSDVTTQRELEARYLQAQKLESIGLLASGLAHDFNNLLTVITGTAELAMADVEAGSRLHGDLEQVLASGVRAAALTRQLLTFSRRRAARIEVVDVDAMVTGMESMLRRLIGDQITLVANLAGPCHVRADLGQLEQVLLNLVINARDAMRGGGQLTISTRSEVRAEHMESLTPPLSTGRYQVLSVSDTGQGIPEDVRPHIFEAFFTTKEAGKGTGLGLSTVAHIVAQAGGAVGVSSAVGAGTTFDVYLPCIAGEAVMAAVPRDVPAGGNETVLVVDDDRELSALTSRVLQLRGYSVLRANGSAEALVLSAGHAGEIDLVVSDVVMPDMGGPAMVERLLQYRPAMRVLYTSGFVDENVARPGFLDRAAFLAKPFTLEQLTRKVRDILDAPTE